VEVIELLELVDQLGGWIDGDDVQSLTFGGSCTYTQLNIVFILSPRQPY